MVCFVVLVCSLRENLQHGADNRVLHVAILPAKNQYAYSRVLKRSQRRLSLDAPALPAASRPAVTGVLRRAEEEFPLRLRIGRTHVENSFFIRFASVLHRHDFSPPNQKAGTFTIRCSLRLNGSGLFREVYDNLQFTPWAVQREMHKFCRPGNNLCLCLSAANRTNQKTFFVYSHAFPSFQSGGTGRT